MALRFAHADNTRAAARGGILAVDLDAPVVTFTDDEVALLLSASPMSAELADPCSTGVASEQKLRGPLSHHDLLACHPFNDTNVRQLSQAATRGAVFYAGVYLCTRFLAHQQWFCHTAGGDVISHARFIAAVRYPDQTVRLIAQCTKRRNSELKMGSRAVTVLELTSQLALIPFENALRAASVFHLCSETGACTVDGIEEDAARRRVKRRRRAVKAVHHGNVYFVNHFLHTH